MTKLGKQAGRKPSRPLAAGPLRSDGEKFGEVARSRRKVSPCGEFLFAHTKRSKKPKAAPLGTCFSDPISFVLPIETIRKAVPAFRGQVSPSGEFLFARAKRNQKRAGGRLRRTASAKGALWSLASFPPDPRFYEGPYKPCTTPHPARKARTHEAPLFAAAPLYYLSG